MAHSFIILHTASFNCELSSEPLFSSFLIIVLSLVMKMLFTICVHRCCNSIKEHEKDVLPSGQIDTLEKRTRND